VNFLLFVSEFDTLSGILYRHSLCERRSLFFSYKFRIMPITTLTVRFILMLIIYVILGTVMSGCAVYYRDRASGAEHIWGIGHLSMKVAAPYEEKQAVIQRSTLTGIAAGMDNGSLGVSVGHDQREHILIYDQNTVITIQRPPSNDFFYFKIGSMPIEVDASANKPK